MDSSPDAAEMVHPIHGTGISFSSKPGDLDDNAVKALGEIMEMRDKGFELEVHANAFEMEPQHLPKGFFLAYTSSFWENYCNAVIRNQSGPWRPGTFFGIGHYTSGYKGLKYIHVYHKGNQKTNWIMVVYHQIHENSVIKYDDEVPVLCHVFQSNSYDPSPKRRVPDYFDFAEERLDSCMQDLDYLMENPKAFKDLDEFDGSYTKWKVEGRNGKRADVWEHFTPIKVLGPDGEVMLTLAIYHHCNIVYQTGKWDSKEGSLSNNGTNTLKKHYRKCSDQHHITGNPQGAHHQIA